MLIYTDILVPQARTNLGFGRRTAQAEETPHLMNRDLCSLARPPFRKRRGEMVGTLTQRRSEEVQKNRPDRALPLRFVSAGWIKGGSGDVEATSQGISWVERSARMMLG